jgi:hypothetical protein
MIDVLPILQSVGIFSALVFTGWQFYRSSIDVKKQRFLELGKRYDDFVRQSLSLEDAPVGYAESDVERFTDWGGKKKELLFYDLLFSLCETAFVLYQRKYKRQWKGWEEWLKSFFSSYPRCSLAWKTCGKYFDERFVLYVDKVILPSLDKRALLKFPSTPDEWRTLPATYDANGLKISDFEVMQYWEDSYMREMAKIVSSTHGDVLEIGYGLGLSSEHIQENGVKSHSIIELHPDIFEKLKTWATNKPNVKAIEGAWEEKIRDFRDESFDGILFDTFPLSPETLRKNHFDFFPQAFRLLRKGGVFTYYSDESDYLPGEHQKMLLRLFPIINIRKITVQPVEKCQYWKKRQIIIVEARKE